MTARRPSAVVALALALGLGVAALAATATLTAAPAWADDADTKAAKRHFTKGEKLFALGRFAEALVQYEQAFDARPLPGFLFNIAQCHRNLGHIDEAIFSYRKYLRLQPDADNRDAVERQIEELEEEQERQGLVSVAPPPPRDDRTRPGTVKKPIYARWWFWGGVAAVAGAGAGTYLLTRDGNVPSTDLGNVVFD